MKSISKLDLNLLKTFNVLMDERNVSKAAKRLSVSQPAVSGMLTRLRESLGDPLFVRAQQGVVPTERALELADPIRRVLQELADIIQPSEFVPEEADFTLTLAGTEYAQAVIIVPLIKTLKIRSPNIKVSASLVNEQRIFQQMENAELDFAFMTPESIPTGLTGKALFEERYVCVVGLQNPLAKKASLTLDEFCDAEHVIVSTGVDAFNDATDTALQTLGRERQVTTTVPSHYLLTPLLQTTNLVAVVPKRFVEGDQSLKVLHAPLSMAGFRKSLVWHERTHYQAAHKWVRQLVFDQLFVNDAKAE